MIGSGVMLLFSDRKIQDSVLCSSVVLFCGGKLFHGIHRLCAHFLCPVLSYILLTSGQGSFVVVSVLICNLTYAHFLDYGALLCKFLVTVEFKWSKEEKRRTNALDNMLKQLYYSRPPFRILKGLK